LTKVGLKNDAHNDENDEDEDSINDRVRTLKFADEKNNDELNVDFVCEKLREKGKKRDFIFQTQNI